MKAIIFKFQIKHMQKLFLEICRLSMFLSIFLSIVISGIFLINITFSLFDELKIKETVQLFYPPLLALLAFFAGYRVVYQKGAEKKS